MKMDITTPKLGYILTNSISGVRKSNMCVILIKYKYKIVVKGIDSSNYGIKRISDSVLFRHKFSFCYSFRTIYTYKW